METGVELVGNNRTTVSTMTGYATPDHNSHKLHDICPQEASNRTPQHLPKRVSFATTTSVPTTTHHSQAPPTIGLPPVTTSLRQIPAPRSTVTGHTLGRQTT
jgi:hypothetical protein